jgi:hypothetical protein
LRQPFDDGFVKFNVSADGVSGSNVVPYLPAQFFSYGNEEYNKNFHKIWFSNKSATGKKQNYFHFIGAGESPVERGNGYTWEDSDISYIFIKKIEDAVDNYCSGNPNPACSPAPYSVEKGNHIRSTTAHEMAHQFRVNSSAPCNGGHCGNNAWCGGAGGSCRSWCNGGADEICLMNVTAPPGVDLVCERSDNVYRLDCSDLSANSGCPEADCSGANHLSIRTNEDPE